MFPYFPDPPDAIQHSPRMFPQFSPTRPAILVSMSRIWILAVVCALPLSAQKSSFSAALLERPDVSTALRSVEERRDAIVNEWIQLVEIPAPSTKEQARSKYIRTEMQKLGLSDIRVDEISNVSGVRKGTGGGPVVVFAAHMDTVFPEGTDVHVKRDGDLLRAPGVGDDTSNLMATLEMFRALHRAGVKTKGDLIFLASVQEELGLLGAKHWLEKSGYKPDQFIAVDVGASDVWYGALRISQLKFFFTSPGAHTLESRGVPSPAKALAKAVTAIYQLPLPPLAEGFGTFKLPVMNVGMLGGGTVVNAIPRETWFTVDLRSLDTATQDKLETALVSTVQRIAEEEKVGFRMERKMGIDYSKARPQPERLNHPLVQTALATANHFRKKGTAEIAARDAGANDSNIAVSMGIPAVAVGAVIEYMPHRLEEYAEASSIIPGIQSLIALAVSTAGL